MLLSVCQFKYYFQYVCLVQVILSICLLGGNITLIAFIPVEILLTNASVVFVCVVATVVVLLLLLFTFSATD